MFQVLAILSLALNGALPTPTPEPPRDPMRGIRACSKVSDEKERLGCYDREVALFNNAIADRSIVVITHAQIEKADRETFGYGEGDRRIKAESRIAAAPKIKEVQSAVRTVRSVTYGRYNIGLADGSVWQNVDPLSTSPRLGDRVEICKTPFGAYLMKIPFLESVHAKRIR